MVTLAPDHSQWHAQIHTHTHNDAPQSVGLLWTRDQPDAEASIWQHRAFTRDRYLCPRRDSNPQSQQGYLRRRGHLYRRAMNSIFKNQLFRGSSCIVELIDYLVEYSGQWVLLTPWIKWVPPARCTRQSPADSDDTGDCIYTITT